MEKHFVAPGDTVNMRKADSHGDPHPRVNIGSTRGTCPRNPAQNHIRFSMLPRPVPTYTWSPAKPTPQRWWIWLVYRGQPITRSSYIDTAIHSLLSNPISPIFSSKTVQPLGGTTPLPLSLLLPCSSSSILPHPRTVGRSTCSKHPDP